MRCAASCRAIAASLIPRGTVPRTRRSRSPCCAALRRQTCLSSSCPLRRSPEHPLAMNSSDAASPDAVVPASQNQRTLNRAESFLKVVQENSVEFAYCTALASRNAQAFAKCFVEESGTYKNFLVQTQAEPRTRPGQAQQIGSDVIPVSGFPRYFQLLTNDIREWQVTFHSVAHSATTTVFEYTLRGLWSGRLPSMVVGIYDRPIQLRCIDTLRWDEAHRLIQRVDVLCDRLDFLIQIGMAQAQL